MTARLSHLNDKGEARMVDVSAKAVTARMARAEGFVAMAPATLDADPCRARRPRATCSRPRASPASWRPSGRMS